MEIEKRKTEGEERGTRTWIQFTVMMDEESKNEDRGENENLGGTRADKVLNESQGSVHWQRGIIHGVT